MMRIYRINIKNVNDPLQNQRLLENVGIERRNKVLRYCRPEYCRASEGMVVYANNLGWKNVPLCDELRQELGVPVRLSNDANCAALGEVVAGAAKGAKSAIMITLGTGVGGGVILNGKVYEGDVGPGTEMGHTTLILGGEPCTCGASTVRRVMSSVLSRQSSVTTSS